MKAKKILFHFGCCSLLSLWGLGSSATFFQLPALAVTIAVSAGLEPMASAQTSTPDVARRLHIQWNGTKGTKLQIFVDSGQKGARFHGATPNLMADFMLQIVDGSAQVMRYTGSGDDWKWSILDVHPAVSHPDPTSSRVEFDAGPLASAKNARIVFRFLDKDWNPISVSKVLTWMPS